MSKKAESLLEQLRKLPLTEQQEILQQLLRSLPPLPTGEKSFPTVKLNTGPVTAKQVADALEDE